MGDRRIDGLAEDALGSLRDALASEYELRDELGRGSSAVVFRAVDLKLRRPVAIKVLRPEVVPVSGSARFEREIAMVAGLSHPHIVALFASGNAGGLLFYVMPLVEGKSLRDRLHRARQLPLDEALRLTRDVASALQHAHDHGFVHRDVKPENVLVTDGSVAALADFGLASVLSDDEAPTCTLSGVAVGTAAYMSPEQAAGDAVDARTDQYALACVLYEMLTGVPPFHAATVQGLLARHRSDPPPSVRLVRPSVPQGIEEALLKAMAKMPADRYASVTEFVKALEGALTTETLAVVRGRGSRQGFSGRLRAKRLPLTIAAACLAAVAVFAVRRGTSSQVRDVDQNRIAVAPFDVFDPADSVWRYGMVEMLSRNFDGAGPLRAVPISVVARGWTGPADLPSVARLTGRTGSGLALFGQMLPVGTDMVRVRATLRDVRDGRTVREFEITNGRANIPRIADSITVVVLRELAQTRAIASVRRASFLSSNIVALRAFLRGEQYYRANEFVRANDLYEMAIDADSGFAVAYRRMRGVLRATTGNEYDSLSYWYALRAGERNQGQSRRDSLLLVADSIAAALSGNLAFRQPGEQRMVRRRFEALERATKLYPDDPEAWMELAEARYHVGDWVGETRESALAAFESAIRHEPDFAPPYFHAVELALSLRSTDSARSLVHAYRRINPADRRLQLVEDYLAPRRDRPAPSLGSIPTDTLLLTAYLLAALPGRNARMAEGIYRHLLERPSLEPSEVARTRDLLVLLLLSSGRLADAEALIGRTESRDAPYIAYPLALLGSTSERTDSLFQSFQRSPSRSRRLYALAWFGASRDTVALRRFEQDQARAGSDSNALGQYLAQAGRAYTALARGDHETAIRLFANLPDSLCGFLCLPQRLAYANERLARGDVHGLARDLERWLPPDGVLQVERYRWMLLRARVAEAEGNTVVARGEYAALATRLGEAEGSLATIREEARAALDRLSRVRP